MTHDHNQGLKIKNTITADGSPLVITFEHGETAVENDDVMCQLNFIAPDESSGTDAVLIAAGIEIKAEADFTASANKTKMVFKTAQSAAAVETMAILNDGRVISDTNAFSWCSIGLDNVAAGNANPIIAANISTVTLQDTGVARFNYTNASNANSVAAVTTHNTAGGTANYNNSTSSYIQFTYYHSNGSAESASGVNMVSFGGN
jgi:hypothetical protein